MAEAENRINEYLEEKVKEDHEEKDKKDKTEAERAKSEAEPTARGEGESQVGPIDIAPQGNVTQGDQPRSKRETPARASEADGDNRELEGKQLKTDEPGAMPQKWTSFVSSPLVVVDQAAGQEASSSSQGPRCAPIRTAASHRRDPAEAEPDEGDEGEAPVKAQRIFSICVGHGAADTIGR